MPFILMKTVIKNQNIPATFLISHLQDRSHSFKKETQWLALFAISGSNWAIFQHIRTHLDALYQGWYCFHIVLSVCHCIALVRALSARETAPLQWCYHLVFFKIRT